MLLVHPKIIDDNILIPKKEWKEILINLKKIDEIKIVEELTKKEKIDLLLGLGADIWKGVDPVKYQRNERNDW